ncbi:MAG: glycoside hydrolase family 43 protein [Dechloromonas sp.]|nr:MAG: glycoside hydrolase family 43 protein [Dechloromonas sp.]
MKRLRPALLLSCLLALPSWAGEARFTSVRYSGVDGEPVPADSYRNPIIAGFYPDPSVIRVGDDFYLTTSTFGYFPGLPIFHSRDLVNWEQIGNAIDRPDQMPYGPREEISRGLFAATLAHHQDTFYITNTCFYCPGHGIGNFVITAHDPAGPWSDPVWLPFDGIDPSLFFDIDGTAWMVHNGMPDGEPRYEGHRAIWLQRFDTATRSMVGERYQLVDSGVHPDTNPEHVEGPHIFRRGDWYYLIAAEGGTGEQHAQMVWRSRTVTGPYEAWMGNPTLTQRDLDPSRPDPITSTGHAQFVELQDGSWWTVFLATRPYRGNQYNLGRETFLLPLEWQDDWPVVLPRGAHVPAITQRPTLPAAPVSKPTTGSFAWEERFTAARLPMQWLSIHSPRSPWYQTGTDGLRILAAETALGAHATQDGQPSYLSHRLQHHNAVMETTLDPSKLDVGDLAGLALVQNEGYHLVAAVDRRDAEHAELVLLLRAGKDDPLLGRELARQSLPSLDENVQFRIRLNAPRLDVDYALGNDPWQSLGQDIDASQLSVDTASGFIGNTFGPYALHRAPQQPNSVGQ